MNQLTSKAQLAVAALVGLLILHTVMLLALFSGVEPTPPAFFGPFIGTTIAAAAFAIPMILWQHEHRLISVIVVLLMAVPGVGPQKVLTEPDILVLLPIVFSGTICLGILIVYIVSERARTGVEDATWSQSSDKDS